MKTVIGIVGEKGSGKETFAVLLAKLLLPIKVAHVRSSDILAETLTLWDIPKTRHNLQNMAIIMDKGFSIGILTRAVSSRIAKLGEDVVIFDGVRWQSDAEMIKSFQNSYLVYITADIKTRYERTKARKEKAGESDATFESFQREEMALTELDIPKIGARADMKIDNSGEIGGLEEKVKAFFGTTFRNLK